MNDGELRPEVEERLKRSFKLPKESLISAEEMSKRLAMDPEESRAVRFIAERAAIERGGTMFQWAEHKEYAQEEYEFLKTIVFREQFRRAGLYDEMLALIGSLRKFLKDGIGEKRLVLEAIDDLIAKCEKGEY